MKNKIITAEERNAQLEELRQRQIAGTVPQIPGNVDPSYKLFINDKDYIHVKFIETFDMNTANGKYEDRERVQMFNPQFYSANEGFLTVGHKSVQILHDPRLI